MKSNREYKALAALLAFGLAVQPAVISGQTVSTPPPIVYSDIAPDTPSHRRKRSRQLQNLWQPCNPHSGQSWRT